MKGIILAGGKATRLYPVTNNINKQLLPVYDKPMIYYPLSILMLAGIKDILIISSPEALPKFKEHLGDGSRIGINISYAEQSAPRGLPEAFIIGEKFIGQDDICLILGDNLFFGHGLPGLLAEASKKGGGATLFCYRVKDPERYGVAELDANEKIISIEEKPKNPKSNFAVTGLYFFDNRAINFAKTLAPSARGELEILDLSRKYLDLGELDSKVMGRGFAWFDTGTFNSLAEATDFVKSIQTRQGQGIACIEEIAFIMGFITKEQLERIALPLKNSEYGNYIFELLKELKTMTPEQFKKLSELKTTAQL
jgi:glucose-1-phosphate thymidylyltransferase